MCASYGLDPRFKDSDDLLAGDQTLLEDLRAWAIGNGGETLLPTGKNLRNLNPIILERSGHRTMELAWWGYLVNGAPAKFPSINTRSERLMERASALPQRAVVPATAWFEMQKPSRQWFQFAHRTLNLLAMAAVIQPGRTADGHDVTCYSIVMRPAPTPLDVIHGRAPLLISAEFLPEWLGSEVSPRELVEAANAEADRTVGRVSAAPVARRP